MSPLVANALTGCGLFLAWVVYRLQAVSGRRSEVNAARSVLLAVQHGMTGTATRHGWGAHYFATTYDAESASARAKEDYEAVHERGYLQVLRVPTGPLEALIASPYAGGLIDEATLFAASVALWRIGSFNQLVEQQSSMVAGHLPEIVRTRLRRSRREALARAFRAQSRMLHLDGIGDAGGPDGWYTELCAAVERNITSLNDLKPSYLRSGWLLLADAGFAALLLALVGLVIAKGT